jgi:TPR repeat protein
MLPDSTSSTSKTSDKARCKLPSSEVLLDPSDAEAKYKDMADKGEVMAQFQLALCYHAHAFNHGSLEHAKHALYYFELAGRHGCPRALQVMAQYYAVGIPDGRRRRKRAARCLERACDLNAAMQAVDTVVGRIRAETSSSGGVLPSRAKIQSWRKTWRKRLRSVYTMQVATIKATRTSFAVDKGILLHCGQCRKLEPTACKWRKCERCRQQVYCSVDCQDIDWKSGRHPAACFRLGPRIKCMLTKADAGEHYTFATMHGPPVPEDLADDDVASAPAAQDEATSETTTGDGDGERRRDDNVQPRAGASGLELAVLGDIRGISNL